MTKKDVREKYDEKTCKGKIRRGKRPKEWEKIERTMRIIGHCRENYGYNKLKVSKSLFF